MNIDYSQFYRGTTNITEYNGLSAKNKRKHTAIPASPFTKVTASHGNASMTTAETANHNIIFFFIMLQNPHHFFILQLLPC